MKNLLIRCVLFIIPFLAMSSNATAQNLPGKQDSLYSAVLKEERVIQVLLPENYKPGSAEKYDVLYILGTRNPIWFLWKKDFILFAWSIFSKAEALNSG